MVATASWVPPVRTREAVSSSALPSGPVSNRASTTWPGPASMGNSCRPDSPGPRSKSTVPTSSPSTVIATGAVAGLPENEVTSTNTRATPSPASPGPNPVIARLSSTASKSRWRPSETGSGDGTFHCAVAEQQHRRGPVRRCQAAGEADGAFEIGGPAAGVELLDHTGQRARLAGEGGQDPGLRAGFDDRDQLLVRRLGDQLEQLGRAASIRPAVAIDPEVSTTSTVCGPNRVASRKNGRARARANRTRASSWSSRAAVISSRFQGTEDETRLLLALPQPDAGHLDPAAGATSTCRGPPAGSTAPGRPGRTGRAGSPHPTLPGRGVTHCPVEESATGGDQHVIEPGTAGPSPRVRDEGASTGSGTVQRPPSSTTPAPPDGSPSHEAVGLPRGSAGARRGRARGPPRRHRGHRARRGRPPSRGRGDRSPAPRGHDGRRGGEQSGRRRQVGAALRLEVLQPSLQPGPGRDMSSPTGPATTAGPDRERSPTGPAPRKPAPGRPPSPPAGGPSRACRSKPIDAEVSTTTSGAAPPRPRRGGPAAPRAAPRGCGRSAGSRRRAWYSR